jgi:hypothetical protein
MKWFVAAHTLACLYGSLFLSLNMQVAYFLKSAEMASDDKFEEKMKVDYFNRLILPCNWLIFVCRTLELLLPILSLKTDVSADVFLRTQMLMKSYLPSFAFVFAL